ncbi:mechanosensitive ion channel family protein [Lacticigenium naphthae]|uniref:mechanosensitive ion channel family protein n=1 Tax=Lacticigenium naphthae TaxID=515351 RepID=UPI0004180F78|nr:mechanosensitive ion channel family protein [Lacticigenium naphthae]
MDTTGDSSATTDVVNEVAEQTNIFLDYFKNINWNEVSINLIGMFIQLMLALILFGIVRKIGTKLINLSFKKHFLQKSYLPNRYQTIHNVTMNVFNALLSFLLVYSVLSIFGVPVGTLLAGAGVIGLALSLGAQGFVSDIVNGLMILLERQLDIGDYVVIGDISGTVMDVNLKTTKLKDFDGTVHYIPNREITIISNKSREDMRVLIQIRLFPKTDFEKIRNIMETVHENLLPLYSQITEKPSGISFVSLDNGQVAAQVIMYVKNGEQWTIKNDFFEEYVEAITQAGIKLPANTLEITTDN